MKKELFTSEPDCFFVEEDCILSSFSFKGDTITPLIDQECLQETLSQSCVFPLEQNRFNKDEWGGSIETCFIINSDMFGDIKHIDGAHILNYSNRMLSIVLNGHEKSWLFATNFGFPCYDSTEQLRQLIHLYNQENLYFHIYKYGNIKKTIKIKNPFQFSREIEKLLLDIDIDTVKRNEILLPVIDIIEFLRPFWLEFIKQIISTGGNYHFIA